ncbi:MAG TPA: low molecular weight protein-tyrosine-phosphatase [Frankiaceae bacterium]|nr:low molecular weight protein-tyrosine-phosphatase [Frankiaceae bacterium]
MVRVCFVCMGNICRSPMAEVVFRALVAEAGLSDAVSTASAGTGGWHAGDGADRRAVSALRARGYDGSAHRARQFTRGDFAAYDLVVALDRDNERHLRSLAGSPEDAAKIRLLLADDDVPDPYYGGADGFEHVLDLVENACRELLAEVAP